MSKSMICSVLVLGLLGMVGCDKSRSGPPAPRVDAGKAAVAMMPSSAVPNPSVPSAESVLTPSAAATAKDERGTGQNAALTRAQESSAMPMSGQVNNHSSTALDSAKHASAPR
jgi:hypothetical protein